MLSQFISLLAQVDQAADGGAGNMAGMQTFLIIGGVILTAMLIFAFGNFIAKTLRMADHGWKIGLILLSLVGGVVITVFGWPPKQGIDLSGGVILVYEVSDQEDQVDMPALIAALNERINPSGVKEIVVRQYGERQVEIIIPNVSDAEIDYLKQLITKAGVLKFRILAHRQLDTDSAIFTLADQQNNEALAAGLALPREVRDESGELLGEWVEIGKDQIASKGDEIVYKVQVNESTNLVRESEDGKKEVLVRRTIFDVDGKDLQTAQAGYDSVGQPAVDFSMTSRGSQKFGALTGDHINRRLGIIMDDELLSAPNIETRISGRGQIHGNFTQSEIDLLVGVLKAGKLPTTLKKDAISHNQVSAILGKDTVEKGQIAIGISFCAVLLFMLLYYRLLGIVACFALGMNVLLILMFMIMFQAAFTLPGLAGLVLTVGMSVDANVLIFERIREEINRGAALRMAIRNGFARATTTIVDANITTLITALVLYAIGTDQIRGFAVTLILGILMSMFTAIFCSRVVFDIAERKRWIKKISVAQLIGQLNIDFIGKRRIAAVASLILIAVGLCGAVYRGKNLFDIDFNGGTSVEMMLVESTPIAEVRKRLDEFLGEYDPSVIEVRIDGHDKETVYKVDTAITGEIDDGRLEDRDSFVGADLSGLVLVESAIRRSLDQKEAAVDFQSRNEDTGEITTEVTLTEPLSNDQVDELVGKNLRMFQPVVDFSEPSGESQMIQLKLTVNGVAVLQDQLVNIFDDKVVRHTVETTSPTLLGQIEGDESEGPAAEAIGDDTDTTSDSRQLESTETAEPETSLEETQSESSVPVVTPSEKVLPEATESNEKTEPATIDDASSSTTDDDNNPDDPRKAPVNPPQPVRDEDNAAITPELPEPTLLAFAGSDLTVLAQADIVPGNNNIGVPLPGGSDFTVEDVGDTGGTIRVTEADLSKRKKSRVMATFTQSVNMSTVESWAKEAASLAGYAEVSVEVEPDTNDPYVYKLNFGGDEDQTKQIVVELEGIVDETPVWLSANKIGGKVAGKTRNQAIAALMISLVFIVLYIWIRFQRVFFGLAAVVALLHDVMITLGIVALSFWLADFLGILLITEFKINLPIVAAFLTIIGYSLNDTIVVFDRIREVRGKSPKITSEMINTSINQTLSRTVLTSFTTLLVVLILYVAGGESIHGFAFALVVGVMVGTYSSIFVASPALLWMSQTTDRSAKPKNPVPVA